MIVSLRGVNPVVHETAFVAESAQVIGNVTVEEWASLWFNAVIRGDSGRVVIGKRSNVQDGCIIHPEEDSPVIIGENVTLGHGAVAHSCKIGSNSLIGMRAVILDKAEVGEGCIIGACSLVTEGSRIPDRTVAWGVPAKPVRSVEEKDLDLVRKSSENYVALSRKYRI